MPLISQSARLYQERRLPNDRTTRRLPMPRVSLAMHPALQYAATNKYPSQPQEQTPQPPDASHTQPWPMMTVEELIGGAEQT